jgi:hypothetical protein
VRVLVPKRFMPVPVRMRLRHHSFVSMAMRVVVEMAVLVLDCLVRMVMGMPFGQIQPDAERHQQARNDQLRRDRLAQQGDRRVGGRTPAGQSGCGAKSRLLPEAIKSIISYLYYYL